MCANYYHARDVAQRIVNLLRTPVEDVIQEPRMVSNRLYTHDQRSKSVRGKRTRMKSTSSPINRRHHASIPEADESDEVLKKSNCVGSPMCHKVKTSNMRPQYTSNCTNTQRVEIIGAIEDADSIELMTSRYPEVKTLIMKDHVVNLYSLSTKGSNSSSMSMSKQSKEFEKFSEYSNQNRRMAALRYENSYKRREKNDTSIRRGNKITYF